MLKRLKSHYKINHKSASLRIPGPVSWLVQVTDINIWRPADLSDEIKYFYCQGCTHDHHSSILLSQEVLKMRIHPVQDTGPVTCSHHICTISHLFLEPFSNEDGTSGQSLKTITFVSFWSFSRHLRGHTTCPVLHLTFKKSTHILGEFNADEAQVNGLESQMRTSGWISIRWNDMICQNYV